MIETGTRKLIDCRQDTTDRYTFGCNLLVFKPRALKTSLKRTSKRTLLQAALPAGTAAAPTT
jgi:hypothetical protein